MVDGVWVDEPSRVKKEFRDHFAARFQDPGICHVLAWFIDAGIFTGCECRCFDQDFYTFFYVGCRGFYGDMVQLILECYVGISSLKVLVASSFRRMVSEEGVDALNLTQFKIDILGSVFCFKILTDRWVWDMNGDGVFHVKDVRNLLDETFLRNQIPLQGGLGPFRSKLIFLLGSLSGSFANACKSGS
ncbi:hypothetical protein Tco_0775392 [Tanacetum coccineum]